MPLDVLQLNALSRKIVRRVLAWVWPPACAACFMRLGPDASNHTLCATCYATLPWWRKDEVMEPELGKAIDNFTAPFLYDGVVRELILRLKFKDATGLVPLLAQWLKPCLPSEEYVLVGVPAHPKRVRERGFSQTVMLVRELSRATGSPCLIEGMKRLVMSDGQVARTRKQRLKMRASDFMVAADLQGKNVVLVDDIVTTGGTVNACARALKKAGAKRVNVVTLAYTPPASEYLPDGQKDGTRMPVPT